MKCMEFRIVAADGPARMQDQIAHVQGCADCAAFARDLPHLQAWLRIPPPESELPDWMWGRIARRIMYSPERKFRILRFAMAACAAFLVAVGLLQTRSSLPVVDGRVEVQDLADEGDAGPSGLGILLDALGEPEEE